MFKNSGRKNLPIKFWKDLRHLFTTRLILKNLQTLFQQVFEDKPLLLKIFKLYSMKKLIHFFG